MSLRAVAGGEAISFAGREIASLRSQRQTLRVFATEQNAVALWQTLEMRAQRMCQAKRGEFVLPSAVRCLRSTVGDCFVASLLAMKLIVRLRAQRMSRTREALAKQCP